VETSFLTNTGYNFLHSGWGKIQEAICETYAANPAQRERIKKIMDKSAKLALPLLNMCKLLKSQKQIDAE
jgi:hypothetical protein